MCNSKYVSLTSLKLCVMDEFVPEHFYNTSVPNFKKSAGNKVRQEKLKKNAIWHFMWNFPSTAFMEQQQYVVVATLVCR